MLKRDELTHPASCLNSALSHEMLFVLLARDPAAPDTITRWIEKRLELEKNQPGDAQITEAYECARVMEHQRSGIRKHLKQNLRLRDEIASAARNMDWRQVVENGGPPCFFLENQKFCGRAERWQGHAVPDFHEFVSLETLLREHL